MRVGARRPALLLAAIGIWVAALLGRAIATTQITEQDAAYYCHVAERFAAGDGLTSLVDRRGPRHDRVELPRPLEANTLYPAFLGGLTAVTGNARLTGAIVSLAALLGAIALGAFAIARGLHVAPTLAILCVSAGLLHRDACQAAVAPLTDAPSLLLNVAVIAALVRGRTASALALAIGLVAAAIAVRFQNVALLLPLAGAVLADPVANHASERRSAWRRRTRAGLIATAGVAALAIAGDRALEGLAVFVNPFERDSLPRGVRFLLPGLLVALVLDARSPDRNRGLQPFWLLGLGHFLVLLANYDASDGRPWLFAQRHGLPFQFVAAAGTAVAISASRRGWPRLLLCGCLAVAVGDNIAKPWRVASKRAAVTSRPDLTLVLDHLHGHPLPAGSIPIDQDADVLAHRLRIPAVHFRSHRGTPTLAAQLRERGITHAILKWLDHPVLGGRNAWMDELAGSLGPHATVVVDLEDSAGKARALVLRLRP